MLARAIDRIFILHADHEQNASTSTVRLRRLVRRQPVRLHRRRHRLRCGARRTAAPTRPCSTCWTRSAASQNIPSSSSRVKDKHDHVRLMGFGHRVYKNYDPRAKVMRETCHEVLTELGIKHDPLLELAMELEQIALEGRVLHRAQALSERRLLLGHHAAGDGHPDLDVHRALRPGAHRRLDRAVERDDRGSRTRRSAARASSTTARPSGPTSRCTCEARRLDSCPGRKRDMARSSRGPRRQRPGRPSKIPGRCRASCGSAGRPTTMSVSSDR